MVSYNPFNLADSSLMFLSKLKSSLIAAAPPPYEVTFASPEPVGHEASGSPLFAGQAESPLALPEKNQNFSEARRID
jgi:hypothetical protein